MTSIAKILIVEDDPAMQATLSHALERENYLLSTAPDIRSGQRVLEEVDPDLVLLDLKLPDGNGRELFDKLKEHNEEIIIIVLTAFPDLRGAISLMKNGAYDYLVKPFDLTELKMSMQRGLELKNLKIEVTRLKRKEKDNTQINIIGESVATKKLRETVIKVAESSDSTVLITGESGTGKELVANGIHAYSRRRNGPLVAINCSAIPENLVESELFGYEKGAFTNAHHTTKGVFELAHGGTLFLDEIGELSLTVQPKLLRALESRKIKRVGGVREISFDTRIISATNKEPQEEVNKGNFREDLFYRLNVIPIKIDPLRERVEDVLPLLKFFAEQLSREAGLPEIEFASSSVARLKGYRWPGNAREMKNLVERLMIINSGEQRPFVVESAHLPKEFGGVDPDSLQNGLHFQSRTLEQVEQEHIQNMMIAYNGNKSEVSRQLGISRNTLKDKLKKYALSP